VFLLSYANNSAAGPHKPAHERPGADAGQNSDREVTLDWPWAQLMVADHTKANRELERLAKAAQIPLPSELNPEDKSMRSTLESVSADAFDLAYMQGQVVDH
jgi:predicted outer membrane protein